MEQIERFQSLTLALQHGRGKALSLIKAHQDEHYTTAIEKALIHACLYDLRHDKQKDNDRVAWLFHLIEHAKNPKNIKNALVSTLEETSDINDRYQQFGLCLCLSNTHNDNKLTSFLYQFYAQKNDIDSSDLHKALLRYHGLQGLAFVAETAGQRLIKKQHVMMPDHINTYREAVNQFSHQNVANYLIKKATRKPEILHYLYCLNTAIAEQNQYKKKALPRQQQYQQFFNLERLITILQTENSSARAHAIHFSRYSTEKQRMQLYQAMLKEKRETVLCLYFTCFRVQALPKLSPWLFQWLELGSQSLIRELSYALSHHTDERIRKRGLFLLQSPSPESHHQALLLLKKNYLADDISLILAAFQMPRYDDSETQSLCDAVYQIYAENPQSCLTPLITWAFDNAPSTRTREMLTKALTHLDPNYAASQHTLNVDEVYHFKPHYERPKIISY